MTSISMCSLDEHLPQLGAEKEMLGKGSAGRSRQFNLFTNALSHSQKSGSSSRRKVALVNSCSRADVTYLWLLLSLSQGLGCQRPTSCIEAVPTEFYSLKLSVSSLRLGVAL